jgi:protein CpxP
MKRLLFFAAIIFSGQLLVAQVKPGAETELDKSKNPSGREFKRHHKMHKEQKLAMMKELNFSDEQKVKMKELKASTKLRKEAILNDSKLTEEQKHEQMKALHKERADQMNSFLSPDQRKKMKEFKLKMKEERKGRRDNRNNKGDAEKRIQS